MNLLDLEMLNPGLSALWEEEKRRREKLNIKTPLEVEDEGGLFSFISTFKLSQV